MERMSLPFENFSTPDRAGTKKGKADRQPMADGGQRRCNSNHIL